LLDRLKQWMPLDPITLPAGETTRIQLRPPLQLGNQGGLLSLRPPEVEQRQAADQLHRTSGALQKSFNSASYLLADQFNM